MCLPKEYEFKQSEKQAEAYSSWRLDSNTTACNILLSSIWGGPALISNGKCVFQSSSLCQAAVVQQTHMAENHFCGFHLVDEIAATFIERTHNTICVKWCPLLEVI